MLKVSLWSKYLVLNKFKYKIMEQYIKENNPKFYSSTINKIIQILPDWWLDEVKFIEIYQQKSTYKKQKRKRYHINQIRNCFDKHE